jgi:ankyrin repeat protein
LVGLIPLVFAAAKDDAKSIRSLVAAGADPNYALPSGNKVIVVASSNKSVAAVNALVVAGADPNVPDNTGSTPLHMAAQIGDVELVHKMRLPVRLERHRRGRPSEGRQHEVPDVGADHVDVTVGEVQQLEDPVDHRVPERDQRVDAAERQPVDG